MVLLTSCGHVQDSFWAYLLAVSKLHLCTFMRSLQPLLSRPCFCCFRVTVFLSTNVPTRKSHVLVLSQVRVALAWPSAVWVRPYMLSPLAISAVLSTRLEPSGSKGKYRDTV